MPTNSIRKIIIIKIIINNTSIFIRNKYLKNTSLGRNIESNKSKEVWNFFYVTYSKQKT